MNLEFLILNEINMLGKTNIGLIIVDGASILRHLQMKSEEYNQKTLKILTTAIASLDHIRKTYEIPILITNRSVLRIKDNQNIPQPASNSIMEYWAKIRITIERTLSPAVRKISLDRHPTNQSLPREVKCTLVEKGFI